MVSDMVTLHDRHIKQWKSYFKGWTVTLLLRQFTLQWQGSRGKREITKPESGNSTGFRNTDLNSCRIKHVYIRRLRAQLDDR